VASPISRKWRTIADQLRRQIVRGELQPGDRLPSEAELMERWQVSRNTVRLATAQLVNEGLIETLPGRTGGNRVRERNVLTFHASHAENPGRPFSESDSWATEVRAHGFEPSQDFECHNVRLPADVAQMLGQPESADAVRRRCIRYVNGQPSSIQDSYYPAWLCDEVPELRSAGDIASGTTLLLADRGHVQVGYLDDVLSRMPSQDEAELLDIGAGTSVLIAYRVAGTASAVVRVTVETMVGDRNQRRYEIGDVTAILQAWADR
jgi:GntR family transcriptional regulator